jgi:hypothetical protein
MKKERSYKCDLIINSNGLALQAILFVGEEYSWGGNEESIIYADDECFSMLMIKF